MGIGTSLGAYFENDFNHQAGIQEPNDDMVKKPADTGDDNVVPPDPQEPKKDLKTDVSYKTASPKVTITDDDIEKGMNIAMSFGVGAIENAGANYTNYIKMFTDKAKQILGLGEKGPKEVPWKDLDTSDPFADYVKKPIVNIDDFKQVPYDYDQFLKPPSPKDLYLKGVQDAHEGFKQDFLNHAQAYQKAISEGKTPAEASAAAQKYTQEAYRGLHLYQGGDVNPVFDYNKGGVQYSTASPALADMYSSYLSHHPGIEVPPGTFGEGANVLPLRIDTSNYHHVDAQGQHWTVTNAPAMNEAKKLGKVGVRIDNVWDEPNSTKNLGSPKTIFITFPEGAGTIKSRFAEKFDPSSPNMMHGAAAVGVGGSAGYVSIEDRRDQSTADMVMSHIKEQLTMDKVKAILQHPLASVGQTLTANQPDVPDSELGRQLGSDDIAKMEHGPLGPTNAHRY